MVLHGALSRFSKAGDSSGSLQPKEGRDFQQGRGKAVIVMPFIKTSLIRFQELRQNGKACQLREGPGGRFPHKKGIALQK